MDVVTIDLLCRCCLNEGQHLTNLHDRYVDDELVLDPEITNSDAIFMCTNVRCDENDANNGTDDQTNELPKTICSACLNELRVAVNFRVKCETTDRLLRQQQHQVTESNQLLFENFCVEEIVENEQIEDETGRVISEDATENAEKSMECVCSCLFHGIESSLEILKLKINFFRKSILWTMMLRTNTNLSFHTKYHRFQSSQNRPWILSH